MVEAGQAELGPRGSHDHFERIIEARGGLRSVIAGEIAVEPERIALMTSTSEGCRVVVAGLGLGPDDEIVTTDAEHFGMLGPLHASGARVRVAGVRDRPVGEALDAILAEVGPKTKLVAVSHVLWVTGQLIPIAELKEALSVPLLVDGAQSVGAIPVEAEPYDFYTVSGQKWLCGPTPTGGLYVRDPESLRVAWPSYFSQASYEPDGAFAPRAGGARFEQSWIPAAFIAGLETAISLAPDWRFERARAMTDLCREQFVRGGLRRRHGAGARNARLHPLARRHDRGGEAARRGGRGHSRPTRDRPAPGVVRLLDERRGHRAAGGWTVDPRLRTGEGQSLYAR